MVATRIILGLGTNVGDRLRNLTLGVERIAERILDDIKISQLYESEALLLPNSPPEWNQPFYNIALSGSCKREMSALELLIQVKMIESDVGRQKRGIWAPRELDIDILAWGEEMAISERLSIPHRAMHERPFALWPLADVEPQWRFPKSHELSGTTALEAAKSFGNRFLFEPWKEVMCGTKRADKLTQLTFESTLEHLATSFEDGSTLGTTLVGIVNLTPDSFSDGGTVTSTDKAIAKCEELFLAGARIIDLGAESTRPGAIPLTADLEWERLSPVLVALDNHYSGKKHRPRISIDTYHAATAEKCGSFHVDWINDVGGGRDSAMLDYIAQNTCQYVAMHSLTIPADKNVTIPLSEDPIAVISTWANNLLLETSKRRVSGGRIILDPGIGFGKTAEQSVEILSRISELVALHPNILVGHSRKSFLGTFGNLSNTEKDMVTAELCVKLALQGVKYLRVHNVAACKAALLSWAVV